MLGWTVWLLGSFAINVSIDRQPFATPATIRWVLMSALMGIMLAWPAVRLSQRAPQRSTAATLCDLFILMSLLQLVIWPARVVPVDWSIAKVAVMDYAFLVYGLITAMIIDHGRRCGGVGRAVALGAAIGWAICGLVLPSDAPTWARVLLSPIQTIYRLSMPNPVKAVEPMGGVLSVMGLAVVVVWVLTLRLYRRRQMA